MFPAKPCCASVKRTDRKNVPEWVNDFVHVLPRSVVA
jgi:hypothetical protein